MAALELDMRSGQNVVIITRRRYGKSSLIHQAIKRLRAQGVLVANLDLRAAPTKELLVDRLATTLSSGLLGRVDRTLHKVQELFGRVSLTPTITLNPDGSQTYGVAPAARNASTDTTLMRLLELPGQIAKEGKKVAVVLDEFQESVAIDPHLPALIRSVWQLQPEVSHVFLGSKRHMMAKIFTDENQPMFRMAVPLHLGPIEAGTFARFIQERFASTEQEISDDTVDRVLAITLCHPGDTQELAFFLWNLAATERVTATVELVDRALALVVEAENTRYTELWTRLSPHQRLMLTALLTSGGASAVYSEAYRRQYRLGPASSVQRSVKALMENDLVEEGLPGEYNIPDPFLRAWLARMIATSTTTHSRT